MGLISSPLYLDTVDARLATLTDVDVERLFAGSKLSA